MAQALHVDQYSLSMAQFYWAENMNDTVSFELFVRSLPKHRGYLVVAGLGTALWHLRKWRFTTEEIDFLRSQELYKPEFLDYLRDLDFTCNVYAIPEGTVVGAQVPILCVTGPRIQATLVESLLLSIINHQTMIASKTARIVAAADGRQVWDFSLRRLHGPEASLGVARAAYIAGAAGTATVEAGRILKIPTTGTMAHAQIMAYGEDREQEVFERVLKMYPENHALLVDTYDTRRGIKRAIAASMMTGIPLKAIRIDSDLEAMASAADDILDGAALTQDDLDPKVLASNDLDEWAIMRLRDLPVDGYGVGTMLGTSADAPHLGGVYKLVEQRSREPRYVMKLTPGKQTDPGAHQVWRISHKKRYIKDVLDLYSTHYSYGVEDHVSQPLLRMVMKEGRIVIPQPSLEDSRMRCVREMAMMPPGVLDLEEPEPWPLERSKRLWELRARLGDAEAKQVLYTLHIVEVASPTQQEEKTS